MREALFDNLGALTPEMVAKIAKITKSAREINQVTFFTNISLDHLYPYLRHTQGSYTRYYYRCLSPDRIFESDAGISASHQA